MEPKFNTNRPEQSPEIKVVNFFSKPDEVVVADDGMIKSEYTTDPNDKSNMVWKLVDSYPDSGDVTNERVTKHRIEYRTSLSQKSISGELTLEVLEGFNPTFYGDRFVSKRSLAEDRYRDDYMGLIPNHREVFEVGGRNYYTLEEARRKAESDREAILARKVRTNLGVVSALDAIFLARAAEIPSEDSSGRGFGVVDYHSNVETGREITGISFRFPDRKTAIATLNERILEIGEKKKELDEEGNDWNRTEVDVLNNHQQFLIDAVETFSRMEDDVKS